MFPHAVNLYAITINSVSWHSWFLRRGTQFWLDKFLVRTISRAFFGSYYPCSSVVVHNLDYSYTLSNFLWDGKNVAHFTASGVYSRFSEWASNNNSRDVHTLNWLSTWMEHVYSIVYITRVAQCQNDLWEIYIHITWYRTNSISCPMLLLHPIFRSGDNTTFASLDLKESK